MEAVQEGAHNAALAVGDIAGGVEASVDAVRGAANKAGDRVREAIRRVSLLHAYHHREHKVHALSMPPFAASCFVRLSNVRRAEITHTLSRKLRAHSLSATHS